MDNEIFNTFGPSSEQGAGEWKTFDAIVHDKTSIFHAATNYVPKPRKKSAIRFGASRLFVLKHT